MDLRVLEGNLNFSETTLEVRLLQGKAGHDAAFAEPINERNLWLHDWIGEETTCTEEPSISIRNRQQQLSDLSANSKLARNRLRGHLPQPDLSIIVMD